MTRRTKLVLLLVLSQAFVAKAKWFGSEPERSSSLPKKTPLDRYLQSEAAKAREYAKRVRAEAKRYGEKEARKARKEAKRIEIDVKTGVKKWQADIEERAAKIQRECTREAYLAVERKKKARARADAQRKKRVQVEEAKASTQKLRSEMGEIATRVKMRSKTTARKVWADAEREVELIALDAKSLVWNVRAAVGEAATKAWDNSQNFLQRMKREVDAFFDE